MRNLIDLVRALLRMNGHVDGIVLIMILVDM